MGVSQQTIESLTTPPEIATRIGDFRLPTGIADSDTAQAAYDVIDFHHAVSAFWAGLPAVSLWAARQGFLEAGVADGDVLLFSELMDASSVFLTANADTVYLWTFIDLSAGPVVVHAPPQCLGMVDDMWWRWVTDIGFAGPDRGQGGDYLLVPPDYAGPLPEGGMYVAHALTNRVTFLARAFLEDNDPAPVAARIRETLRIHRYIPGSTGSSLAAYLAGRGPLVPPAPIAPPRFVEGSHLAMNTVAPVDATFWPMLDAAIQAEPAIALDPELAAPIAAAGIVHGRPFQPDAHRTKILAEAAEAANATLRAIALRPRREDGYHCYPDTTSSWVSPLFAGGHSFTVPPPLVTAHGVHPFADTGAILSNARASFFYVATGISPAMCTNLTGIGSQYLMTALDATGGAFDGARSYRLTLPSGIPAQRFWSVTVYDPQTRSMLDTPQHYPRAGSQSYPTPAAVPDADGTTSIYFAPQKPDNAADGNWIQTIAGRSWFVILRLYSPTEAFFDKTWRPGDVEPVAT